MTDTYYDVLGVQGDATTDEIRSAYLRLVRQAHPDAGGSAMLFRLVQTAYDTLADPQRRTAYDATVTVGTTTPQSESAATMCPVCSRPVPASGPARPAAQDLQTVTSVLAALHPGACALSREGRALLAALHMHVHDPREPALPAGAVADWTARVRTAQSATRPSTGVPQPSSSTWLQPDGAGGTLVFAIASVALAVAVLLCFLLDALIGGASDGFGSLIALAVVVWWLALLRRGYSHNQVGAAVAMGLLWWLALPYVAWRLRRAWWSGAVTGHDRPPDRRVHWTT